MSTDEQTITIDTTPTWTGILPAMLAANANMQVKHTTGKDADWSEEAYETDAPTDPWFQAPTRDLTLTEKAELVRNLTDNETEFKRMAKAADNYNRLAKFIRKTADELSTSTDISVALNAIFTELADIADID